MADLVSRTTVGPVTGRQTWFEWVFNTYYNELRAFTHRYVGSDDAADDVLQDLYISIWRDLDRWMDAGDALRPLLFVAARNRALDHLRSLRARERRLDLVRAQEIGVALAPSADASLLRQEIRSLLDTAIASLPPRARQIYLLSREEGLTYREIAKRLRLSHKTVENQMGIALARLRKILSGYLALIFSLNL